MKKLYTLSLLLLGTIVSFGQIIYSENVGTGSGTQSIANNQWQNTSPIIYSGTADTRATLISSGYTGASGDRNIFFTSTIGKDLLIEGLNTSNYSTADLQLSFGQHQGTNSATPDVNLIVEVSTDGTDFTPLSYSRTNGTGWELVTITSGIPSATNLRIRFRQASTIQYRVDDIAITVVSASCLLNLGANVTACDEETLNLDTYTVSIPFTGGGTETYNITTTSGTISGDNPSNMAEGNITVTGITEGTDITVTVVGGTCNLERPVIAPSCKPVNTLPFMESFNYTVGNALTDEQTWAMANSGDDIVVIAGNLNYTGINSTGNSVSLSGSGAEAYTPFTSTTSGTLYVAFLMSVTDMSNVTADGTETVFATLLGGDTEGVANPAAYRARIFIKKAGEQYQLGLATGGSTTNYTTSAYNVNDEVLVVMGYDFNSNVLNAWINPALATFNASTPATLTETVTTPITDFAGFLLRQDGASDTPTITIDELKIMTSLDVLGTKSFNSISGLTMYPNPLSGNILNIVTDANATKSVAIYNILGKEVLSANTAETAINVAGLTAGVYIVKITEEGKTATRKLVIK
ncbi:T9SS type A sorting domain-containing protein [Flavobacterium sp. MK4S-17]|uniref:T9SS type A sorting domain-containing protein n=1 Tax=Flavobacterium sp. MK4S-17 TaxID=2543737 RepID=UPI0013572C9A|nr:T9SS type A sorting domain-containing protein [Flavobacterium sp. MK4S-17]